MTDLTDGYHYAIVFDKERIIEKKKDLPIPYCEGFCCQNYQYLAPVPSYKKYISLVNWKEDLMELCTVKERIIEKYENIDTWWKAEYTELKEENTKLKKLLKKHRDVFARTLALCIDLNFSEKQKNQFADDIAKIDQALGEDK